MSYEKQPEPVLPNYNPSAWDTPLSAEEKEVLDAYYVKFPIAQNAPITFPNNITINGTTALSGTTTSVTGTLKTNTLTTVGTADKLSIATTQAQVGVNFGSVDIGTPAISNTTLYGKKFPLTVVGPSQDGTAFKPIDGFNQKGNISIWSTFPSIIGPPADISSRRIVDLVAGFTGDGWVNSFLSLCVGPTNGVQNDAQNITAEQMRISMSTITMNKPITVAYLPASLISTSMIGYTLDEVIDNTSITTGANYNAMSVNPTLPAGVWLISYSFRINSSAPITMTQLTSYGLDNVNAEAKPYAQNINGATVTGNLFGTSGTFVVSSTGTTQYNIRIFSLFTAGMGVTLTVDNSSATFKSLLRRTRIA